jgi:hypothetical protein
LPLAACAGPEESEDLLADVEMNEACRPSLGSSNVVPSAAMGCLRLEGIRGGRPRGNRDKQRSSAADSSATTATVDAGALTIARAAD